MSLLSEIGRSCKIFCFLEQTHSVSALFLCLRGILVLYGQQDFFSEKCSCCFCDLCIPALDSPRYTSFFIDLYP